LLLSLVNRKIKLEVINQRNGNDKFKEKFL